MKSRNPFPLDGVIAPIMINDILRVRNLKGLVVNVALVDVVEVINDHTQPIDRVCALIEMNDGRKIETHHEAGLIRHMWLAWAAGGGTKAVRS